MGMIGCVCFRVIVGLLLLFGYSYSIHSVHFLFLTLSNPYKPIHSNNHLHNKHPLNHTSRLLHHRIAPPPVFPHRLLELLLPRRLLVLRHRRMIAQPQLLHCTSLVSPTFSRMRSGRRYRSFGSGSPRRLMSVITASARSTSPTRASPISISP